MSGEGKCIFRVGSLDGVKEYWKNKVIDKIKRNWEGHLVLSEGVFF